MIMLSWNEFTKYAAELNIDAEYVAQNKPFFDNLDPIYSPDFSIDSKPHFFFFRNFPVCQLDHKMKVLL